jgi:hypothetical protein
MGQPRAVLVPQRVEKYLGFVLQAPECVAVDDAVAVHLEGGADGARFFRVHATAAMGALAAKRRHEVGFAFFELFPDVHGVWLVISASRYYVKRLQKRHFGRCCQRFSVSIHRHNAL